MILRLSKLGFLLLLIAFLLGSTGILSASQSGNSSITSIAGNQNNTEFRFVKDHSWPGLVFLVAEESDFSEEDETSESKNCSYQNFLVTAADHIHNTAGAAFAKNTRFRVHLNNRPLHMVFGVFVI